MNKPLAVEWCFVIVAGFSSDKVRHVCWGIAVGIMLVGLYCECTGRPLS